VDALLLDIGRMIVGVNNTMMDYLRAAEEAQAAVCELAKVQFSLGRVALVCAASELRYPEDVGIMQTRGELYERCAKLGEKVKETRAEAVEEFALLSANIGRCKYLWEQFEEQEEKG
jgi:hypothetical protein